MKVFNLEELEPEKGSEVFYEVEEFSGRVIELPPGGSMPPCEMDSYVLFYVISGKAEVTVGGDKTMLQEASSMATEPTTLSMDTEEGVRILGIQVAKD